MLEVDVLYHMIIIDPAPTSISGPSGGHQVAICQARGRRDQDVHVGRPAFQGASGGPVEAPPGVALHRGGQGEEQKRFLFGKKNRCVVEKMLGNYRLLM